MSSNGRLYEDDYRRLERLHVEELYAHFSKMSKHQRMDFHVTRVNRQEPAYKLLEKIREGVEVLDDQGVRLLLRKTQREVEQLEIAVRIMKSQEFVNLLTKLDFTVRELRRLLSERQERCRRLQCELTADPAFVADYSYHARMIESLLRDLELKTAGSGLDLLPYVECVRGLKHLDSDKEFLDAVCNYSTSGGNHRPVDNRKIESGKDTGRRTRPLGHLLAARKRARSVPT